MTVGRGAWSAAPASRRAAYDNVFCRALAVLALVAANLAFSVEPGSAHKAITSPYTYNDDVFPILRDRCGRCHVNGGVAPMSLLTHAEAVPWGESIRVEVLAGHMPPAGTDGAARFRNAPGLSPREMNVLLTWITGGTPSGSAGKDPKPVAVGRTWPLGSPDLALPVPSESIAADAHERTSEFIIATGLTERRWVRAVDLLPGNPAIVRAATMAVRAPAPSATPAGVERLLALWLPGEQPYPLDAGLGFELPASAELVVRVLYRKTWEHEREAMRDRSAIGIYFAPSPAAAVQAVRLTPDAAATASATRLRFRRTLAEDARALAIYPEVGLNNAAVRIVATRPDGTHVDLISFHPRPDWRRRYWFRQPIPLPRGTIIDVTAAVDDEASLLPLSLAPAAATRPDLSSLRVTLNLAANRP